jgi:hypothetical protein
MAASASEQRQVPIAAQGLRHIRLNPQPCQRQTVTAQPSSRSSKRL